MYDYETIFDFDKILMNRTQYTNLNFSMKDNIFTLDIPGFTKNDIDVEFDNNILSVFLKDDDKTYKWKITKGYKIESAKCVAGQLIIKFIFNMVFYFGRFYFRRFNFENTLY